MEIITIGGRDFRAVSNSTIEHDFWVMDQVRGAGLDRIEMREGETQDQFVERIIIDSITTGRAFPLLGGLLMPADMLPEDWTPQIAHDTIEFLRKRTDESDKAKIKAQLVALLFGFFVKGVASPRTSPSYSAKTKAGARGPSTEIEEAATSATGIS